MGEVVITGWAAFAISKVVSRLRHQGRMPQLWEDLDKHLSNLTRLQDDYTANKDGVRETFSLLRATLEAISRLSPRDWRRNIKPILKALQAYSTSNDPRGDEAQELFVALQYCRQKLRDLEADEKWRK